MVRVNPDPYLVLGVAPTATQTEITHAYRKIQSDYFADLGRMRDKTCVCVVDRLSWGATRESDARTVFPAQSFTGRPSQYPPARPPPRHTPDTIGAHRRRTPTPGAGRLCPAARPRPPGRLRPPNHPNRRHATAHPNRVDTTRPSPRRPSPDPDHPPPPPHPYHPRLTATVVGWPGPPPPIAAIMQNTPAKRSCAAERRRRKMTRAEIFGKK
jgi:hypothetical protein